jgi:hypothetical protein
MKNESGERKRLQDSGYRERIQVSGFRLQDAGS